MSNDPETVQVEIKDVREETSDIDAEEAAAKEQRHDEEENSRFEQREIDSTI